MNIASIATKKMMVTVCVALTISAMGAWLGAYYDPRMKSVYNSVAIFTATLLIRAITR